MILFTRSLGIDDTDDLHFYAERSVTAALGRLLSPNARVTAIVHDDNGPKGGVDKRCRIRVKQPGLDMCVEATAIHCHAAIDLACDRMAQAVQRKVGRHRALRRSRIAVGAQPETDMPDAQRAS